MSLTQMSEMHLKKDFFLNFFQSPAQLLQEHGES